MYVYIKYFYVFKSFVFRNLYILILVLNPYIIYRGDFMKKDVIEKLAALITAAFGLVAALAWNDTIKAIFKQVFGTSEGVWPMLTYAIIVTLIAVLVTIQVGKAAGKAK